MSTLPKVVITETLGEEQSAWLEQHARVVWCPIETAVDPASELGDADGLVVRTYTQVNDALLDMAPNVKVIGRAGVGLDNFDLPTCKKRGVRVVFTPDANTQAVVEYVFGLILDEVRPRFSFTEPCDKATFHQWRKDHVGQQLSEMTFGTLGVGRIGRRVTEVASAMGMRVLGHDLLDREALNLPEDHRVELVDAKTLYRESDILTIHVDGRKENRDVVNAEVLEQLKPDCLLLNAARGMLLNVSDLRDWLKSNEAAGAYAILDVHEPEPPAEDYPLYGVPNARLLPHLASRTPQALANMSWVVRDVVRVLNGEAPHDAAV